MGKVKNVSIINKATIKRRQFSLTTTILRINLVYNSSFLYAKGKTFLQESGLTLESKNGRNKG